MFIWFNLFWNEFDIIFSLVCLFEIWFNVEIIFVIVFGFISKVCIVVIILVCCVVFVSFVIMVIDFNE